MKTTSGTRPRRGYSCSVRYCACGAQARYAIQVMARTIGQGQSGENRTIKLGKAANVCGKCSSDAKAFIEQLRDSGSDALQRVQQTKKDAPNFGLPLF